MRPEDPKYNAEKIAYLEEDGWKEKDRLYDAQDETYRKSNLHHSVIVEQTDAIIKAGHFDDVLAYPPLAISQLLHHRLKYADWVNEDGSFNREGHEATAMARDLLLAASLILSHDAPWREIAEDLIGECSKKLGWGETEYGLLNYTGVWKETEEETLVHYNLLKELSSVAEPTEFLVRRTMRQISGEKEES